MASGSKAIRRKGLSVETTEEYRLYSEKNCNKLLKELNEKGPYTIRDNDQNGRISVGFYSYSYQ